MVVPRRFSLQTDQQLSRTGATPLAEGVPTFTLKSRIFRLVWTVTWGAFGIWTPAPMHGWRRFLLRSFGADIHATAKIYPGVRIWFPPFLRMEARSCLGPEVICYCMDEISLGPYALVSQRAHLCGGGHNIDDPAFQLETGAIRLGSYAWVGAEAFVGPGVTVGDGAVLGARAVTVKDLAPWTVYVGNPARGLRPRRSGPELSASEDAADLNEGRQPSSSRP